MHSVSGPVLFFNGITQAYFEKTSMHTARRSMVINSERSTGIYNCSDEFIQKLLRFGVKVKEFELYLDNFNLGMSLCATSLLVKTHMGCRESWNTGVGPAKNHIDCNQTTNSTPHF